MDREKLFRYLKSPYLSKREMIARFPLGVDPDELWRELLQRRKSQSASLPLYSCSGSPYWYVVTDRMIAASEKIVETLTENEAEFDPFADMLSVLTLEEVYFTSFVEGSQITMQAAMDFLTSDQPPRDIEEQMIANNRNAGMFASKNLCRRIDAAFMSELAYILTEGLDNASGQFRQTDSVDYAPSGDECFEFPAARTVPGLVDDLCAFLSATDVHPLIKAAVAQCFTQIVRPFPEGNDRLGRVLSNMILLRAGYTFFSDVSLSALIARKGYAYYEAVANILRKENGGDLTYFIEYFLDVLSRAVDERAIRLRQREDQSRRTEIEQAHLPLCPAGTPPDGQRKTVSAEDEPPLENDRPGADEKGGEVLDGFLEVNVNDETETDITAEAPAGSWDMSFARALVELHRLKNSSGERVRQTAELLIKYLNEEKYTFTSVDLEMDMQLTQKQASNVVTHCKASGMIETCGYLNGRRAVYRVQKQYSPLQPSDYAQEIVDTVIELRETAESAKDRRIARILHDCLPNGVITEADYGRHAPKLAGDMRHLEFLGIVKKLRSGVYQINRKPSADHPVLNKEQKEFMSELYERFRTESFTRKDAVIMLNRSKTAVSARLRLFSQMKIVSRTEDDLLTYRLLVTPDDHPALFGQINDNEPVETEAVNCDGYSDKVIESIERLAFQSNSSRDRRLGANLRRCLEKGTLCRYDYEKQGYTKWMWDKDVTLALQLGLIEKVTDSIYRIKKEPDEKAPVLLPSQKKTIAAIYEAFGDSAFSSEMVIATLNYTQSQTYASLHKLTLLQILDRKTTDEGNQYQLLVNPEDNPEFFDTAA